MKRFYLLWKELKKWLKNVILSPENIAIADAIMKTYDSQNVAAAQEALKNAFGPIFEAMLKGELDMLPWNTSLTPASSFFVISSISAFLTSAAYLGLNSLFFAHMFTSFLALKKQLICHF